MSSETQEAVGTPAAGQEHPAHPAHLAHHFESSEQQFSAGKLGMWLFLSTEILLFGGLFVAYSVYRGNHPEVFKYAHHFLDAKLGGINTVVLIASSFTMAMAVRASQLGKKSLLVLFLALTLLGGFGFLGIKFIEYSHKIHHGLLWGARYNPDAAILSEHTGGGHGEPGEAGHTDHSVSTEAKGTAHNTVEGSSLGTTEQPVAAASIAEATPAAASAERVGPATESSLVSQGGSAPSGTVFVANSRVQQEEIVPKNVHIFFGIYFLMTGLHGLHVIIGMAAIFWVLLRSVKGAFSADYFTPVDLVGLYWHLVDLIWIYLFPLLYLIH